MVLPLNMVAIFDEFQGDYTQTCSKTSSLPSPYICQKVYIKPISGSLETFIPKSFTLFSSALGKYGKEFIRILNMSSGINMLISVKSEKSGKELCNEAKKSV